jgi:hypothetical protein
MRFFPSSLVAAILLQVFGGKLFFCDIFLCLRFPGTFDPISVTSDTRGELFSFFSFQTFFFSLQTMKKIPDGRMQQQLQLT